MVPFGCSLCAPLSFAVLKWEAIIDSLSMWLLGCVVSLEDFSIHALLLLHVPIV